MISGLVATSSRYESLGQVQGCLRRIRHIGGSYPSRLKSLLYRNSHTCTPFQYAFDRLTLTPVSRSVSDGVAREVRYVAHSPDARPLTRVAALDLGDVEIPFVGFTMRSGASNDQVKAGL